MDSGVESNGPQVHGTALTYYKRETRIGLLRDEYQDSGTSLIKRLELVSGDLVRGSGSQGSEPLLISQTWPSLMSSASAGPPRNGWPTIARLRGRIQAQNPQVEGSNPTEVRETEKSMVMLLACPPVQSGRTGGVWIPEAPSG